MQDNWFPILAILGIIAITLFGGAKNASPLFSFPNTGITQPNSVGGNSQFKNQITLSWGGEGNKADQEYLIISAGYNNTVPVDITGWKLTNNSNHGVIAIPQSTILYFANQNNSPENVVLSPGEQAYIITGRSPIASGMRVNKCSGYLSQFNTFTPSLYTSCPTAQDESSTTIPRTPNNNNCFNLINSTSACTTHTQALDNSYSGECQQFFSTKLTYQTCVTDHKTDADFYSPKKWYVYLKHDATLWNVERTSISLSDLNGNVTNTISNY